MVLHTFSLLLCRRVVSRFFFLKGGGRRGGAVKEEAEIPFQLSLPCQARAFHAASDPAGP